MENKIFKPYTKPDTGTITEAPQEKWQTPNLYGYPFGMYIYYLDDSLYGEGDANLAVLGSTAGAIQSIVFAPYVRKDHLNLTKIPFDVKRYGELMGWQLPKSITPSVYRIEEIVQPHFTGQEVPTYIDKGKAIGKDKPRSWKNESRLYDFPYSFGYITDHISKPFEVRYNLVPTKSQAGPGQPEIPNKIIPYVTTTVSDKANYVIGIKGYKNDQMNVFEGQVCDTPKDLPCSSTSYSQWFASSKNQSEQAIKSVALNGISATATGALNGAMDGFSGGSILKAIPGTIGGAVAGGIGSAIQGGANYYNATKEQMAIKNDARSTPNSMVSAGSDITTGILLNEKARALWMYRYGLTENYYRKLGDYFAKYGYKVNRITDISGDWTKSRYYYNYIKTVGVNIRGINIPKDDLQQLRNIFDKGTTIWHVFRGDVFVGDYSKDNAEV